MLRELSPVSTDPLWGERTAPGSARLFFDNRHPLRYLWYMENKCAGTRGGNAMKSSKPECKNYIAEDLCAASANHPEEHCHDDVKGDCGRFVPVQTLETPSTEKKKTA